MTWHPDETGFDDEFDTEIGCCHCHYEGWSHGCCDDLCTGSTGVAAIKAGKVFTGIEHNPVHFATAVQRVTAVWEGRA